jgi:hypothetical protein
MPVTFTKTMARMVDVCTVEEAMPLLDFLKSTPKARVDLSACVYLHTALLQLLLQARPKISGWPTEPLLARWLQPLFTTDPQTA